MAQHPEVQHTPAFYLESVWIPLDVAPESPAERVWRDTMEGVSIFMVILLVMAYSRRQGPQSIT